MLDIDTCVAEARTLHPSKDGWFATLRKVPGQRVTDKLHHMSSLDAVLRALDKTPDSYLSQASFVLPQRRVAAFKSVNCAWVDIDCYSTKRHSPNVEPDEAFIDSLLAAARNAGLPEPSYVTKSGRGLYCKWVFERPISAGQFLRWKELQNVLTPLYTAFGVDSGARDAARVLRVMGSAHGETRARVHVARNTGRVHNFDALCQAAAAVDVSKLRWPTKVKADGTRGAARRVKLNSGLLPESSGDLRVLDDYSAAHEPVMLKPGTLTHLNWSRFIDLRTLAELRGGIHKGSRDLMMFWMADFLGHADVVTAGTLEAEMAGLVGAFDDNFDPIGEGSLSSLKTRMLDREAGRTVRFQGGTYDPLYTPTNDHLIDVLGISREEQEQMVTIIDGEEKLRRADEKHAGRAERRQARIEWRSLARELAEKATAAGEPVNYTRIARAVSIDRRQVARLLTGALDRDPKRIETRGRKKCTTERGHRIVISRNGAFSTSVWVAAGQDAAQAIAKAMERRQQTQLEVRLEADRARAARALAAATAPIEIATPPAPLKISPIVARLTQTHPHRVIVSISRKRRDEGEGKGKGLGSRALGAGGPISTPSIATPTGDWGPKHDYRSFGQLNPWTAVVRKSKEREEKRLALLKHGLDVPPTMDHSKNILGTPFAAFANDPAGLRKAADELIRAREAAKPPQMKPLTPEQVAARVAQLKLRAANLAQDAVDRARAIVAITAGSPSPATRPTTFRVGEPIAEARAS